MPVEIDMEKCGQIKDCPGEGLCIKICEQGALIEEDGKLVIIPENAMIAIYVSRIVQIRPYQRKVEEIKDGVRGKRRGTKTFTQL